MARKGWSLRKLARVVKTDPSHLGRFLKGKRGLGLDTALAIAKALDLPIESLGSEHEEEPVKPPAKRNARSKAA